MKKILTKITLAGFIFAALVVALPMAAMAATIPYWNMTGSWDLSFVATSGSTGTYEHHMDVATQDSAGNFAGTGYYVPDNSYTWVIDPGSSVSGSSVHLLLHYTGGHDSSWTTTADATIASNGSLSGTWTDNQGDGGTWSSNSGAAVALGSLAPQDFGVMNQSGVMGYTAGFGLTDANLGEITSAVTQLYTGSTLLQTDTSIPPLNPKLAVDYSADVQFSSPFNVFGPFDYVADGYWANARETEYGQTMIPTKVVATVTLANGLVLTAKNEILTGDPTTIFPTTTVACPAGTTQTFVETVTVPAISSTPTTSTNPLALGTQYILKASGTADAGDGIQFDARYSYRTGSSVGWTDSVSTYESYGATLLDLSFDSTTPWGNYSPSHAYQSLVTGDGNLASFLINDIYYPNNTGNLSVEIDSCNPTTGTLIVNKVAIGGDGNFSMSGTNGLGTFNVQTTNGAGSQTFNLLPGNYTITEPSVLTGWQQVDNDCNAVAVNAGATVSCTVTNVKIGTKGLGEIRGTKYVDRDGDGTLKDGDHHRLAGVTIYLDINKDGTLNAGEPSTVTNKAGDYRFGSLPALDSSNKAIVYVVREVVPTGWIQTVPSSGSYTITLPAGQSYKIYKKNNFGNFKYGSISGMKFNDLNANGRMDKKQGETGLAGWAINLKGPNGFTSSTVTAADGSYSFTGLNAGVYTLSEVAQSGWTQTVHPGKILIQSGTVSANNNFGNTTQPPNHGGNPYPNQGNH